MPGWLVNDLLQTVPGTRTLLNDLVDWFEMRDVADGGYIPFHQLAEHVESLSRREGTPEFIIRNASYFRPLDVACPTIALVQDIAPDQAFRARLVDVCRASQYVVFNSKYTRSHYPELHDRPHRVIPLSVDFDLYRPRTGELSKLREKWGIEPGSVLYVGWDHEIKGADRFRQLVQDLPEQNFVAITRDGPWDLPVRVRQFAKIPAQDVAEIMFCCELGVILSRVDTQNLSGIEMGACGLRVLTTNVGAFWNRPAGVWGRVLEPDQFAGTVKTGPGHWYRRRHIRDYWVESGFTPFECRHAWETVIECLKSS